MAFLTGLPKAIMPEIHAEFGMVCCQECGLPGGLFSVWELGKREKQLCLMCIERAYGDLFRFWYTGEKGRDNHGEKSSNH
jgi:hypothetical protein